MRPLRLELSGFTTFREPVEVDFSDAPYFALVGPTGSGKSSVIDAMTFALYGAVARLDLRSVLPVISQGKQEARVRFDFAIGEEIYTVVRVVRKIGTDRATTPEARLERGAETIAGDADGVTAGVEQLLGLSFGQFTRCVVLPQGEFARFMLERPADRGDLLVRLLGLDVYERMLQSANRRAVEHETTLALRRQQLDDIGSYATEEGLKEVRARNGVLEVLRARIEDEEPKIEALRDDLRVARADEETCARAVTTLSSIAIPADIERIAGAETEARALAARADEIAEKTDAALRDAETALESLPKRAPIERALEAHAHLEGLTKQHTAATKELERLTKAVTKATDVATLAEKAAHEAQAVLEAARTQHRAHDLARELVAGELCPVCKQKVKTVPKGKAPGDLKAAEEAATKAIAAHQKADAARFSAATAVAQEQARAGELEKQTAVLQKDGAAFSLEDGRATLTAIDKAEKAAGGARKEADAARQNAAKVRRAIDQVAAATTQARKQLDAARDTVAELAPPPLDHKDLAADWRLLADWARTETETRREAATRARERAQKAEAEGKAVVEAQRAACVEAGIEDVTAPRDDVLKAIERGRGIEEKIEIALESAKQIVEETQALATSATVARALGQHLKSNAFEKWVLRQALSILTDGATQILLELSAGQYSLSLDKTSNFTVIDHRNANLERSARTLSGGETFLASLALALALSDRIAQLSANTAVSLESIFLDEGFGSLDDETMETVATALEALSATNRVVGVVTHVRALAERVPVRFEVLKGPSTSTVEKVVA